MPFARLLPTLVRLEDLPRLVAAVGHQPAWLELAGGAEWPGTRQALVGRAGDLDWLALETRAPQHHAERVARGWLRRGRAAVVLALDPVARRLALAVAWSDVPVLSIDLDAADRIALGCLARLADVAAVPAGGALALAAGLAEAASGEAVGRRFFAAFRTVLDRFADGIEGPRGRADRHALALLQLTRVLFLHFVQDRGWLDGRTDFLAREVDRCLARRRGLERHLLHPLFFGTLNRPAAERTRTTRAFGRIPFLNGGLFEPHALERRWTPRIGNTLWRDAFDELFGRFHFTVDEQGAGPGVAPDMLGRVFEGVMAPDARRASGTFYTPAAVVHDLVRAAVRALVATRCRVGEGAAERMLLDADPRAMAVLREIRLLDPAVGSGAFLLGALELLTALQPHHGEAEPIRRRILRSSLFGVDLDATAVRLTELRLWLAVIAHDASTDPAAVAPLPNLDCLVRQGDSLHDIALDLPAGVRRCTDSSAHIGRLRHELVTATGAAKTRLVHALRAGELQAAGAQLDAAEAGARHAIAECLADARAPTLFGGRRGLDAALGDRLASLRRTLRRVRHLRRRARHDGELPWFHFQSQFADVFARGGFDLVVGNPPWVRAEQLAPALRARLADRYRWWRTGGGGPGFANHPDLSVAFLERAWELVAPGGVVAMLVPSKIAAAGYGARARQALAAEGTLHALADLTDDPRAAFDATAYPLALIAGRVRAGEGHRVALSLGMAAAETGPLQRRLLGGAPWVLAPDPLHDALERLRADHPRLGDRLTAHLGVKTGANAVFLHGADEVEPALLRWAVRGRDVSPFRAMRRSRLVWPHGPDGAPLRTLPPRAATYLAAHRAALQARTDYDGGAYWTLFRTGPASARYRVVWADLAARLSAVPLAGADAAESVPLNSCYVVVVQSRREALCLAAWLNSSWLRVAAAMVAAPAAGGFRRFGARTVSALPLPPAVLADGELAELAERGGRGEMVQEALDEAAAKHLGLSDGVQAVLRRAGR